MLVLQVYHKQVELVGLVVHQVQQEQLVHLEQQEQAVLHKHQVHQVLLVQVEVQVQ